MNNTMQLYILFILISFSGGSIFIGFPKSNWTTSSQVCSLPQIDNINNTDIVNESSEYIILNKVEKAWTGTVIKYTKWAAFIGCGSSFSPMDSGRSVKAVEDCLRHCSDYSSASYFAMKSSTCYCLTHKPADNGDIKDCRKSCTNAIETPCSSGRSALVFTFVKDFNIKETNTYIEKECLTTTKKDTTKFVISDCNAKNLYGCKNTSGVYVVKSWYDYQELCFEGGNSVLYNRNTIGEGSNEEKPLWAPIFRSHTVVTGKLSGKDLCLALTIADTKYFTVENCSSQFSFLCSQSQSRTESDDVTTNKRLLRFITLPTTVVAAGGIFIIILLISTIYLFCKLKKRRHPLLNNSIEMKDDFPRAALPPNKVGLRDTYIDASDAPKRPGAGSYNDVYDDVNKGFIIKG